MTHRAPRPQARASYVSLLAPLGVTVIVAIGAAMAFSPERAGTVSFWAWATLPTVVLACLGLLRAHRDGELRDWLRFVWGDPTRGILSAAAFVGLADGFVHIVTPTGNPRDGWLARLYLEFGDPATLREHGVQVAVAILVAATSEEIVWRGLVSRQLAEVVGSRTAWIWAAVLYALAHAPTVYLLRDPIAGYNPLLVSAALALGLAWGGMVRVFGRLMPAILSHVAFDWCVLMMFRLWGPGV
jgi:uncharacterized protein